MHEVKSRGAKILIITGLKNDNFTGCYDYIINLPNTDDNYIPLISIIPMQLIAYHTSCALGYNPDKPRNLAKSVTVE